MGNCGEYLSAWPRSELWHDPMSPSSSNVAASQPASIIAKHASDDIAREVRAPRGYSAAEAAQDTRNGAWLTAWPAGEKGDVPSMSVKTRQETGGYKDQVGLARH